MQKILFVSYGKMDKLNWSGTTYNLYFMMKELGYDIDICEIKQLRILTNVYKLKNKINKITSRKLVNADRTILQSKYSASQVRKFINKNKYSFIFSVGSMPISSLNTNVPVFIYIDGVTSIMKSYYDSFKQLSYKTILNSEFLEKEALQKASGIICASDWCMEACHNYYNVDYKKILMGCIGANGTNELEKEDTNKIILSRHRNEIRLLFVGVDWKRKGGKKTLEILSIIKERGYNVTLDIVGVTPLIPEELKGNVSIYGFLNKNSKGDKSVLEKLYRNAHFFVLPTYAECAGVVFCEASQYALPSITHNTGGVSSLVKNDINGYCFETTDSAALMAEYIINKFENQDQYNEFCFNSYKYYKKYLNWNAIGKNINAFIGKSLS